MSNTTKFARIVGEVASSDALGVWNHFLDVYGSSDHKKAVAESDDNTTVYINQEGVVTRKVLTSTGKHSVFDLFSCTEDFINDVPADFAFNLSAHRFEYDQIFDVAFCDDQQTTWILRRITDSSDPSEIGNVFFVIMFEYEDTPPTFENIARRVQLGPRLFTSYLIDYLESQLEDDDV